MSVDIIRQEAHKYKQGYLNETLVCRFETGQLFPVTATVVSHFIDMEVTKD